MSGIGVAATINSAGGGRFADVRERVAEALRGAVHSGDAPEGFPGAIAIGGFAFAEEPGHGPAWPGFADAWFTVPERIWWQAPYGPTIETTWANGAARTEGGVSTPRADAGAILARADAGAILARADSFRTWNRSTWARAVREILARIGAGELSKAVLARSAELDLPRDTDPLDLLRTLREDHPGCYRFLLADGRGAAFLGASPERLIRLAGDRVATEAVAGTLRRGSTAQEDRAHAESLLQSAKERAEHQAVLCHIQEALRPACVSLEAPDRPEVLTLQHMHHLRTPVRGVAREGSHVLDLVARLHPTPAVAGRPRDRALALIRELEPSPRGWYAGPVGWVNARGDGDFAVGIRSVSLRDRRARFYAGAGIVAGSDPDSEWNETELKMRPILDAISRD
jgi:menaquinone-specific isochorismate synthase